MTARNGFGLFGVRERVGRVGGTLRVTSHPDRGTEVRAGVPPDPGVAP